MSAIELLFCSGLSVLAISQNSNLVCTSFIGYQLEVLNGGSEPENGSHQGCIVLSCAHFLRERYNGDIT